MDNLTPWDIYDHDRAVDLSTALSEEGWNVNVEPHGIDTDLPIPHECTIYKDKIKYIANGDFARDSFGRAYRKWRANHAD